MARVYNFNAGPAVLPLEVLEEAQRELLDFQGTGASIIESSHRGKAYSAVHEEALENYRQLLGCSDDYEVMFLSGGATMQFAMLALNLLGSEDVADYVNSGAWATKAIEEARQVGKVNVIADTSKTNPAALPAMEELQFTPQAAYVHITSNETIAGTQWKSFPKTEAPLVADMSSDILSRPFEINQFGAIYAGAQKNIGPSGVALVAIRKELVARSSVNLPSILKYQSHIDAGSRYNTPPTFSIYLMMLVSRWLLKNGLREIYNRNREKADMLYKVIDENDFYQPVAVREFRSDMNVTFRLPDKRREELFLQEAVQEKMVGLKGHRSAGGIRASIYNAFPAEGVRLLANFMRYFAQKYKD